MAATNEQLSKDVDELRQQLLSQSAAMGKLLDRLDSQRALLDEVVKLRAAPQTAAAKGNPLVLSAASSAPSPNSGPPDKGKGRADPDEESIENAETEIFRESHEFSANAAPDLDSERDVHERPSPASVCAKLVFPHTLRLWSQDILESEHIHQAHAVRHKEDLANVSAIVKLLHAHDPLAFASPSSSLVPEVAAMETFRATSGKKEGNGPALVLDVAKPEVAAMREAIELLRPALTVLDALDRQADPDSDCPLLFAADELRGVVRSIRQCLIRAIVALDFRYAALRRDKDTAKLPADVKTIAKRQADARAASCSSLALESRRRAEAQELLRETAFSASLINASTAGIISGGSTPSDDGGSTHSRRNPRGRGADAPASPTPAKQSPAPKGTTPQQPRGAAPTPKGAQAP